MIEIPLGSEFAQRFIITIVNNTYDMVIKFNSRSQIWGMDISSNNVLLVSGIPLISGVDLIHPYLHVTVLRDLKNMRIINTNDSTLNITSIDLENNAILIIPTDEELTTVFSGDVKRVVIEVGAGTGPSLAT